METQRINALIEYHTVGLRNYRTMMALSATVLEEQTIEALEELKDLQDVINKTVQAVLKDPLKLQRILQNAVTSAKVEDALNYALEILEPVAAWPDALGASEKGRWEKDRVTIP